MNLDIPAEDEAFRQEVRTFLQTALTPELRDAGRLTVSAFTEREWNQEWQRVLNKKGWVAPSWPVEYGGTGWTETQRHIWAQECAKAQTPGLSPMGLRMVAPVIMKYGTPEQKAFYLPRIIKGEDYWCQGYSEPGAGSDLANLQLRAVSDGDDYVLNGSKIWTTHAHYANRMFCLTRTNTDGKKQQGITFLLLEMNTPGIEVRPIITMAGDHEVNQVFFTDVRVSKANRLGNENEGWTVAKYLLEFERGGSYAAGLQVTIERLKEVARQAPGDGGAPLIEDPQFARKLIELEIELASIEFTEHRMMAAISEGGSPGAASSVLKMRGTETIQKLDELGIEIAAYYGGVYQREAIQPGANVDVIGPSYSATAMPRYLNNRAASIYGGSNEVQRNIVAGAILGIR
jgi:alkylation response protein AidB-like acyl-CoA dehydrogenase